MSDSPNPHHLMRATRLSAPSRSGRTALMAAGALVMVGAWVAGTPKVADSVGSAVQGAETAKLGLLAAAGMAGAPLDLNGDPIDVLRADPTDNDFDGDGLVDAQEEVLGLSPAFFDTDGDGFGDGEELARQTDPADDLSFPMSDGISVALTARGENDRLRLVIVLHEPAGEIDQSKIRIGALTSFGAVSVPIGRFLGLADIHTSEGTNSSLVTSIDIPLHPGFVHASGYATFFIAAGNQGDPFFGAAAKIDVVSTDGILTLTRPLASSVQTIGGGFQGGGSIRQPIPQDATPSLPVSWVPGAICYRRSTTVGSAGAVVLKQVIEAECLSGWDSFCASDCSSSVGSTFETIDPAALIGG